MWFTHFLWIGTILLVSSVTSENSTTLENLEESEAEITSDAPEVIETTGEFKPEMTTDESDPEMTTDEFDTEMTTDESVPEMTTDESDTEMTTEETDSDSETPEIIEEATTESIPHDPRDDGMWIPYRRKDGTIVDHYIFGNKSASWDDARNSCKAMGYQFATLEDYVEIRHVVSEFHRLYCSKCNGLYSIGEHLYVDGKAKCVVVSMLREQKVGMECDRKPKPHRLSLLELKGFICSSIRNA
ncbi:hypothetical protein RB195_008613 [Necator americanus]